MTDRWRRNAEDDRSRTLPPEERRQHRGTPGREERSHGPDGGLDSGRGFGRIGVSRSDPWAGERGAADNPGRGPWTYNRREDFTGRGPRNYRRPDERILEDVSDRLTDDAMVDASEIEVQVRQGEVTLTGTVRDRDQKRRAEDLAERVSGVKDVINALRIVAGVKSGP
jgi:hypothetical protein